jgi:hypothetical protein
VFRYLRAIALRRGLLGGNRFWFTYVVISVAYRVLKRWLGRTEKVLYREALGPGQTLVIAHERDATVVEEPAPAG